MYNCICRRIRPVCFWAARRHVNAPRCRRYGQYSAVSGLFPTNTKVNLFGSPFSFPFPGHPQLLLLVIKGIKGVLSSLRVFTFQTNSQSRCCRSADSLLLPVRILSTFSLFGVGDGEEGKKKRRKRDSCTIVSLEACSRVN